MLPDPSDTFDTFFDPTHCARSRRNIYRKGKDQKNCQNCQKRQGAGDTRAAGKGTGMTCFMGSRYE